MKVFVLPADVDFSPSRINERGKIVSVFISRGEGLHNFRCSSCGTVVFQYTGDLHFIFDGAAIPKEKATIDVMCHRCKIIYRAM